MIKSKGFTLPEMLISISLGLFLSLLLIKIYLWQLDLNNKMEDILYLDQNSTLIIQILRHEIQSTEIVSIEKYKEGNIFIFKKEKYYPDDNAFWKEPEGDKAIELARGVINLNAIRRQGIVTITLEMIAPHGTKETVHSKLRLENEKE